MFLSLMLDHIHPSESDIGPSASLIGIESTGPLKFQALKVKKLLVGGREVKPSFIRSFLSKIHLFQILI